jgi:hypothetical protein
LEFFCGSGFPAATIKAESLSYEEIALLADPAINGLIAVFTLPFRHAFSRNPVNSTRSGCRINSGMTVLFQDG